MSRRKQQKPRHLDAEDEIAGILENGTATEDVPPGDETVPLENGGDAHVCGNCRAEFLDKEVFLAHKKDCLEPEKRIVWYDEGSQHEEDEESGPPPMKRQMLSIERDDPEEEEDKMDLKSAADFDGIDSDQMLGSEDRSDMLSDTKSDNGSDEKDEASLGADMTEDSQTEAEGIDLEDQITSEKAGLSLSSDMAASLPQFPNPLSMLFGMTANVPVGPSSISPSSTSAEAVKLRDSNVKIEKMDSTKVAVAQFAENNLPNLGNLPETEMNAVQTMLYSLQQQQIMQLQMLQQLQHQIMQGLPPSMAIPAMAQLAASVPLPMVPPNLASVAAAASAAASAASAAASSSASKDTTTAMPGGTTTITSSPISHPTSGSNALNSSANQTTPKTPTAVPSPFNLFNSPLFTDKSPLFADKSPLFADKSPLFNDKTPMFNDKSPLFNDKGGKPAPASNGTLLSRDQYAADDPFFKHKCRFCHKVFGSDSGLQIHIRSHTGERPFKCNICGNRFSTRGNLKVHFSRHKAKYPHVKMNPNPVPERPSSRNSNMIPPLIPTPPSRPAAPPVSMPTIKTEEPKPVVPEIITPKLEMTSPANAMTSSPKVTSPIATPTAACEAPRRSSPNTADTAASAAPSSVSSSSPSEKFNTSTVMATNTLMTPIVSAAKPFLMPGMPPMGTPHAHPMPPPFGFESPYFPRPSILPQPPEEDPMEQYMEIDKSETNKLQQLVDNIETKLTDPNQCAICHRILSCKSALQMHYRIHTGERPFKCKICGRAFTTKGNLKTHMGVHRAKPPMRMLHQCPVCHKQFTNSLVLQQHIRMHTGELPKDMPLPADMMAASGFMPFPGFPFMPPMGFPPGAMPHGPPGMGASGELDLRKPSAINKSASEERDYDFDEDDFDENDFDENDELDEEKMDPKMESEEGIEAGSNADNYKEEDAMSRMSSDRAPSPSAEVESAKSGRSTPHSAKCEPVQSSPPTGTPITIAPCTPPKSKPESPQKDYAAYYSQPSVITSSSYQGSYSTSLMALEERVKAIETPSPLSQYSGMQPLEHMANILRRHEMTSMHNGCRSPGASPNMPPVSDGGSDGRGSPASAKAHSAGAPSPVATSSSTTSPGMDSMADARYPGLPGGPFNPALSPIGFHGMNPMDRSLPFSGGKSTTCNVCFKTFACRSALDIHYRSHTKERPYKCDVCERGFTTRGNMRQHMLTHKIRDMPSNAFKTDGIDSLNSGESNDSMSNRSTESSPTTPSHTTAVPASPIAPVMAPGLSPPSSVSAPAAALAPAAAAAQATATTPPNTTSTTEAPNNATSSSGGSSSSASSGSNGNNSSGNNSSGNNSSSPFIKRPSLKHVCNVCNKPFSSGSALQIHYRTHTGDKPFKCTICGKAFTTKGNLKVHMGTHMWNNSPSRRGRRMSIDTLPPTFPGLDPKGADFFSQFAGHPRPPTDMPFPYPPFPGFPNGFAPKMNEISVIQSINGSMGHLPPSSLPSSLAESMAKMSQAATSMADKVPKMDIPLASNINSEIRNESLKVPENNNNNPPMNGSSGELDLSIRKSPSTGSLPPSSMSSPPLQTERPPSPSNPGWMWKTTCHICNKVCSSASALEIHMKSHMQRSEESSPQPLMT